MTDNSTPQVSAEDVLSAITESMNLQAAGGIQPDTPIVVDSFALVWLQHLLEEKHALVIDPDYADLQNFTSPGAIHQYLRTQYPDRIAA
ncbi:hypothetical protein J7F03_05740 [Streptomyces sp. ISL-43]|uniref:hypothetical protein n=1 Tax=Streptomyces sp. ISL-43 TaxID=2819183 RepID=UPI001BE57A42|nr:hypothetical protein [Streptomyces sp. ISL-43]MBT2446591.1 hypothetical protein [Streptomyces sp. ISL-43]